MECGNCRAEIRSIPGGSTSGHPVARNVRRGKILSMMLLNCPTCGAWVVPSEIAEASGYVRCGVCAHIYPLAALNRLSGRKLVRYLGFAAGGAGLVITLAILCQGLAGHHPAGEPAVQALFPGPAQSAFEPEAVAVEPAFGGWQSAHGIGGASLFGAGTEGGAVMAPQNIWLQRDWQQLGAPGGPSQEEQGSGLSEWNRF